MIRTKSQNSLLHWQLAELNIPNDVKEDLVFQFTNGREKRSSAMTPEECSALTNHLNVMLRQRVKVVKTPKPVLDNTPENKMRRKVISLCYDLRLTKDSGKIDMQKVNALCVDKSPYKKDLDSHTAKELTVLITVVEKIVKSYLKNYAKR